MACDVVALGAGGAAVLPPAGETEVVGGLSADVVVAEVVVEVLGVGEGVGAPEPFADVRRCRHGRGLCATRLSNTRLPQTMPSQGDRHQTPSHVPSATPSPFAKPLVPLPHVPPCEARAVRAVFALPARADPAVQGGLPAHRPRQGRLGHRARSPPDLRLPRSVPPPLPVPSSPPAGISPPQAMLDGLLDARPGASATHPADTGINFTMFLTMMSERLFEFDPEADLKDAFECFDEADSGLVKVDEMRKWLADVGERMDQQQVPFQISPPPPLTVPQIDKFLNGPFTDRHGNFNYREWIKVLRVNDDVDDPEPS